MNLDSRYRQRVAWFASVMLGKLVENKHKGDWHAPEAFPQGVIDAIERLKEEVRELEAAAYFSHDPELIIRRAADVANFALMIADLAPTWERRPR